MNLSDLHTPLDEGLLANAVGPGRRWQQVDIVAVTGSTNADLLARSAAGQNIDGSVLVAEHQTAGRGRRGRTWSAPPRSQIAVSVGVAASSVPPSRWGWLPLLAGIAVADAVQMATGIEAGSKWPNDVLVASGKLAGILAEVATPLPMIVVGLGLNVTLTADEAPDPAATSLLMLGSAVIDRNVLLAEILRKLEARIDRWCSVGGADAQLVSDYQRLSTTLGKQVRANLPGGRRVTGVAEDIDEFGRLILDAGNEVLTVSAADISQLRTGTELA